jgi:hypothetical protein
MSSRVKRLRARRERHLVRSRHAACAVLALDVVHTRASRAPSLHLGTRGDRAPDADVCAGVRSQSQALRAELLMQVAAGIEPAATWQAPRGELLRNST